MASSQASRKWATCLRTNTRGHGSPPPLNAVRASEAAARHPSITLTAEELHVAPGADSRQIKTLEDALGVPLFVRGHAGHRGAARGFTGAGGLPQERPRRREPPGRRLARHCATGRASSGFKCNHTSMAGVAIDACQSARGRAVASVAMSRPFACDAKRLGSSGAAERARRDGASGPLPYRLCAKGVEPWPFQ